MEMHFVSHHDDVGKAIMEWEQQGWRLTLTILLEWAEHQLHVNHYLLFEEDNRLY